ncbi:MAG: alkaline phosphatase D family protein, partial [Lewinella sp.]|nr:alkaline phosphatase D family protein [Lewinella sp.]
IRRQICGRAEDDTGDTARTSGRRSPRHNGAGSLQDGAGGGGRISGRAGLPARRCLRRSPPYGRCALDDARLHLGQQLGGTVRWEVSTDPEFRHLNRGGRCVLDPTHHYRVKIDTDSLLPATTYYYRFEYAGQWSPVGRTRTAPDPQREISQLTLAVVSCNALEWGYFNAFANLARRDDLQAIIHLGDYIYEYATGVYGDTTLGRFHEPRHELVSAADYHQRYAQYRRDPQLQSAHQAHPFICIWDDHEVANNSHSSGAENHNPATQGDYLTRMTAARQIYYDWMPVRENPDGRLYRSFQFGQLAELHMLDERLAGRTAPATTFDPEDLADTSRHMLGETQLQWLCSQLERSPARWQLLGNQVLFADLDLAKILPQYAVNTDAWDGYRHEKNRLIDSIRHHGWNNIVFLTGDTHCSWYFAVPDDATAYRQNAAAHTIAHEFAAPSVSSANYDEFVQGWDTLMVARHRLFRDNAHLNYTNLTDHGYLLLHLRPHELKAEFHYLKTIRQPVLREGPVKTFSLPYVSKYTK